MKYFQAKLPSLVWGIFLSLLQVSKTSANCGNLFTDEVRFEGEGYRIEGRNLRFLQVRGLMIVSPEVELEVPPVGVQSFTYRSVDTMGESFSSRLLFLQFESRVRVFEMGRLDAPLPRRWTPVEWDTPRSVSGLLGFSVFEVFLKMPFGVGDVVPPSLRVVMVTTNGLKLFEVQGSPKVYGSGGRVREIQTFDLDLSVPFLVEFGTESGFILNSMVKVTVGENARYFRVGHRNLTEVDLESGRFQSESSLEFH